MFTYSSLFTTAPNGGSEGCALDNSQIYYNGLGDEKYLSCDHYNQLAIPPSDLGYHYSFDDQLVTPPSTHLVFESTLPTPASIGGGFQTTSLPAVSGGYNNNGTSTAVLLGDEKKKRQDHNASERNRRKRINGKYDSLRAVLPATNQMKLSIPSTVERALKYIPELQNEVQHLLQRKERLLPTATTSVASQLPYDDMISSAAAPTTSCATTVEATQLGSGEFSIQISALKSLHSTFVVPISEVLRELDQLQGVVVVDVSSSESSAGIVFYRIHLMVEETQDMKCEILREKVLLSCQIWENMCSLWMI